MRFKNCLTTMVFCLLLGPSTVMLGQAEMDVTDKDVSALLHAIDRAHQERSEALRSSGSNEKHCDEGKGWHEEGPSEMCFNSGAAPSFGDEAFLKGCYFKNTGSPGHNPCVELARYYNSKGRYVEALAAVSLPNAQDGGDLSLFRIRATAYKGLGNVAKQKEALHQLCYGDNDFGSCATLQDLGVNVDIADADRRSTEQMARDSADEAQRRADAEQEQRDKAASRAATIAAISSIGAAPQASAQAPSYNTTSSRPQNPSYSPSGAQSPQSCRDMTACVKVLSSTYDANHFLHVIVRNTCNSQIRITTSVYAQNRSCTVGQTSNFSPGDSQDMGSLTDRNWYQFQADDSVRSSVDGSGCKLMIANSCDR